MIIVLLITLYTSREVLHVLGVDDYGIYGVVGGFVSLFAIFNNSFTSSIIRFYNAAIGRNRSDELKDTFQTAFIMQVLVAIIVVVLVEAIGYWYINHKMVLPPERLPVAWIIFHISVFSLALTVVQAPFSALIMAKERMDYFAVVSIVGALLGLANVFLLKSTGSDKLLVYGFLQLGVAFVTFFMYVVYCYRCFKEARIGKIANRALGKSMISFSGWSLLEPVAYTMRGQGCNMVLNLFFGPAINTAYTLSNQIANALEHFTGSVTTAFTPQLMQSFSAAETDRTKGLVLTMTRINFALQLVLCLPLIVELNYVLHLWLGADIPAYTASFAVYILIINAINSIHTPLTKVVQATGRIRSYMTISSILVATSLPLAYVLLKSGYPADSIYLGMVILTVINLFVCLFITTRVFPDLNLREYFIKVIIPCILCTAIGIIAVKTPLWCLSESFWRLVLTCLMSIVSVGLSAYFLLLNKSERAFLLRSISSFLHKIFRSR